MTHKVPASIYLEDEGRLRMEQPEAAGRGTFVARVSTPVLVACLGAPRARISRARNGRATPTIDHTGPASHRAARRPRHYPVSAGHSACLQARAGPWC